MFYVSRIVHTTQVVAPSVLLRVVIVTPPRIYRPTEKTH